MMNASKAKANLSHCSHGDAKTPVDDKYEVYHTISLLLSPFKQVWRCPANPSSVTPILDDPFFDTILDDKGETIDFPLSIAVPCSTCGATMSRSGTA
jgi:hypothetical protein